MIDSLSSDLMRATDTTHIAASPTTAEHHKKLSLIESLKKQTDRGMVRAFSLHRHRATPISRYTPLTLEIPNALDKSLNAPRKAVRISLEGSPVLITFLENLPPGMGSRKEVTSRMVTLSDVSSIAVMFTAPCVLVRLMPWIQKNRPLGGWLLKSSDVTAEGFTWLRYS